MELTILPIKLGVLDFCNSGWLQTNCRSSNILLFFVLFAVDSGHATMYHNLEPLEGSTETGDIDPLYSSQGHAFCAKVKQLFVGYGGIGLAIVGVIIVSIVIGLTVHAYHRPAPDSHLHNGPIVSLKCGQVRGSHDNEAYAFKVSKYLEIPQTATNF